MLRDRLSDLSDSSNHRSQSIADELKQDNPSHVALDCETHGLEFHHEPFAISCAWMKDGEVKSYFVDLENEADEAREIVAATNIAIFHNAKFDLQKLILGKILKRRIQFEDTEGLAHLLDEHRLKGLKYLAKNVLGLETDEDEVLKATRSRLKLKKSDGYYPIYQKEPETLIKYAIKDAEFTLLLFQAFWPLLQEQTELARLYAHEKELTWVLLDIESKGLGLDGDYVTRTLKSYSLAEARQEMSTRDISGNEEFNPRSNPQIKEYFIGKGIVRDKYDKSTLLAIKDPMGKAILSLRTTAKMRSTYLRPMYEVVMESKKLHSQDLLPILHPHFKQYKPVTGRMASGKMEE